MNKGDHIFVEAEIIGQQDGVLTVKLLNCFGNTEANVHTEKAIVPATGGQPERGGLLMPRSSYCGIGS